MGEHEIRPRAIFLDRDGVINKPVVREGLPHPPAEAKDFELYDDVPAGCARLEAAGYLLVVVTNQPDVARGAQTRAAVDAMHRKMLETLPQIRGWKSAGTPAPLGRILATAASLSPGWSCARRKHSRSI